MPIEAYIDGACSGNPGPGGWGIVLVTDKGTSDLSGFDPDTTNNRMELTAAIMLLKHLSPDVAVTIHADSQYVVKGVTEWMANWKRNGWRNAQKKAVENRSLWEELDRLVAERAPGLLRWEWVKGHAGHPLNERADRLAVEAIQRRGSSFDATKVVAPAAPPAPAPAPVAARLTYGRHSGTWYRNTVAIPGTDRFWVEVRTDDFAGSFTIDILQDPEGEHSNLSIGDCDLGVLTAVPEFFVAYTAAVKARGTGMSADAIEILLLRSGATETTPREKPAAA